MGKRDRFEPYKPCPCGSGEKYKFCCYAAGRELPGVETLALARHDHRPAEDTRGKAGAEWFESPFAKAVVNGAWRKTGLADLYFFRQREDQYFGHAYLVDVFGLGLKDCFPMRPLNASALEAFVHIKLEGALEADLALAQTFVWGGLRYARENGFRPPSCALGCARAVGGEPVGTVRPASVFGYGGGVHIVGDWEDLLPRLDSPKTMDEALEEWDRRGFHFTIGSRDPSFPERFR
jgi:hypothetical protein